MKKDTDLTLFELLCGIGWAMANLLIASGLIWYIINDTWSLAQIRLLLLGSIVYIIMCVGMLKVLMKLVQILGRQGSEVQE
jgi:hypothetical protein